MGKSSSLKKKRSKNSSQSKTRKRNKVKSRRSKSKKLRRQRDDSVSYSGDSNSRSMVSISSSSSEDDYRSRRSRSRYRKDVKGGEKRARRRSSGRESSEDSPCIKKRRGSRRDGGYETRKRAGKRKKSRRDVIVSFRSSGSSSCSTCRSSSDEIGYDKRRGRSERKEKDGRILEKVKRGSKRRRDRSRSCSSCSRYNEGSEMPEKVKRGSKKNRDRSRSCSSCSRYNEGSDCPIEDGVMEESNSRRLKSVITVAKRENESCIELNADEPKEEVYDYDDYPSCRSNDSNDGCGQRELPQRSHVVSETKRPIDDEHGEVSNIRTSSVEESGKDGKPRYDGVGENDVLDENKMVSSATGGFNGDDMELILRQRALENLRKFRGGLQTNINPPITLSDKSDDVKTPSSVNTDLFQIKTPMGDDARVVIASQVSQQIKQCPVRRDSTLLPKNDKKTSHLNDAGKYSGTVGSDVASPPAQVVPADLPRVEVNKAINSVSNKSKLVMSRTRREAPNTDTTQKQKVAAQEPSLAKSSVSEVVLETDQTVKPSKDNAASISIRTKSVKSRIRQESPHIYNTQKQESAALESSQAKLVTENSVNEGGLGTAQTVKPPECGNNDGKVNNTLDSACIKPSSSSISTSGDISSDKLEDETKDGSQFQQKTMSVMRGGEMVQVNYQVYIPKRAPALARRQLKR
ncbi:uncharacterized protein LOC111275857 [Durio zibethinus]|uniref:Uncharacterized protein LOC111275857 n=1 Tax=Durio zibethinus TaxID=66656 RepID=A0A6P5WMQ9_DURZI|nr:uncharacterized protein LOC111275857 [Durio zibethinus]